MSRSYSLFLLAIALSGVMGVSAQVTESGRLTVYPDAAEGRMTSSGALYSGSALTAAHASLPMGTAVRVASFDTGRMVDVIVNDRKPGDANVIVLSRAAADQLGIKPGGAANGAVHRTSGAPSAGAPAAGVPAIAAAPATSRKTGPLAAVFSKDKGAGSAPKYAIPADRYAPPVQKKGGGIFSKKDAPVAAYPAPNSAARPELQPLSAMGPVAAPPRVPARPAVAGGVALPPASPTAPYRVQFGAFKRQGSAEELSTMLDGAGIPSSVFLDTERGLNVVVTDGGFATANEAQRWIDFEGMRRRWTERPVVIR